MKATDLRFIAEENDLQYIETTPERNGYPSKIKGAIIGFDNFDKAQEIADENGLSIEIFTKKDGWQLWYRTGNNAYKEFKIDSSFYGEDYLEFEAGMNEGDFFNDEIEPMILDCNNFEELEKFIEKKKEIFEAIKSANNNETVLVHDGCYFETVEKTSMGFYHDANHSAIGLIER